MVEYLLEFEFAKFKDDFAHLLTRDIEYVSWRLDSKVNLWNFNSNFKFNFMKVKSIDKWELYINVSIL